MNKCLYVIILLLVSAGCSTGEHLFAGRNETPETLMKCVSAVSFSDDLSFIAVDRTLRSPGHQIVREYCARRLADLGFRVELDSYGTGVNVIGRLEGTYNPGEAVILSAHYDSRCAGCPGADDNASGVAGVLESARVLSKARYSRTLIVALWDEEERGLVSPRGLIGSRSFARRARLEGAQIVLAAVFEMIGYRSMEPWSQKFPASWDSYFPLEMKKIAANKNRGDFICLTVRDDEQVYSGIFTGFSDMLELPSLTLKVTKPIINVHDFRRSDHAAFWENNYPALLISDTTNYRNTSYHCHGGRTDDVANLDLGFACDTISATVGTLATVLIIR